jgi:hypothetical protein
MNAIHRTMRAQRGQATSEFIAAMALFIPLLFGVIYVGKFGDVKHQAIQASRYLALQRALDPHGVDSDTALRDKTVARFFRDGGKYKIGQNEPATAATATDTNPNWYDVTGKPLINAYNTITAKFGGAPTIASPTVTALNTATLPFDKLPASPGFTAEVEVPIANIAHFAPLNNANLKIAGKTVMAGDPWNAAGAEDVADHLTHGAVVAKTGGILQKVKSIPGINTLFQLLAGAPAPDFGCVKADVVPGDVASGASYSPGDPQNSNDQCF